MKTRLQKPCSFEALDDDDLDAIAGGQFVPPPPLMHEMQKQVLEQIVTRQGENMLNQQFPDAEHHPYGPGALIMQGYNNASENLNNWMNPAQPGVATDHPPGSYSETGIGGSGTLPAPTYQPWNQPDSTPQERINGGFNSLPAGWNTEFQSDQAARDALQQYGQQSLNDPWHNVPVDGGMKGTTDPNLPADGNAAWQSYNAYNPYTPHDNGGDPWAGVQNPTENQQPSPGAGEQPLGGYEQQAPVETQYAGNFDGGSYDGGSYDGGSELA